MDRSLSYLEHQLHFIIIITMVVVITMVRLMTMVRLVTTMITWWGCPPFQNQDLQAVEEVQASRAVFSAPEHKSFQTLKTFKNFKTFKLSWTQIISNFHLDWFSAIDLQLLTACPKSFFSVFLMDCLFWHDAGYEMRTIGAWSFYWGDGFHYTFTKESGTNSECVFCQTESHRKIRRIHTNCGSKWNNTNKPNIKTDKNKATTEQNRQTNKKKTQRTII